LPPGLPRSRAPTRRCTELSAVWRRCFHELSASAHHFFGRWCFIGVASG
jgi:hypothetical protein